MIRSTSIRLGQRAISTSVPRASKAANTKPLPTLAGLFGLSLFSTSSPTMTDHKVQKSDSEWRAVLSPEQFRVLRQKGTEAPGSSSIEGSKAKGVYHCAGCDAPLYTSDHKFDSGCGWPAYFDTIPGAVDRHDDNSMFMKRTEITCHNCGGHLGHVFLNEV